MPTVFSQANRPIHQHAKKTPLSGDGFSICAVKILNSKPILIILPLRKGSNMRRSGYAPENAVKKNSGWKSNFAKIGHHLNIGLQPT